MPNNLEYLIEERKLQAVDRQIESKVSFVAHNLGKYIGSSGAMFSQYLFRDEEFDISRYYQGNTSHHVDNSLGTTVTYLGRIVFEIKPKGVIYSYVPGSWEKKLDKLFSRAQQKIKKAEKAFKLVEKQKRLAEKAKKEAELRARFGL